jgi:glycosyltransferase involved in cell wall biosynthesis
MKTGIVFVERIFPLYRKAVFNKIYKEKKFIFFHSIDKDSGIKQTDAEYSSIVKAIYYGKKDSSVYLRLLAKLFRVRPRVIVHEFSAGMLSILPLIYYCKITGTRLIFWGHMYNRTAGFNPAGRRLDRYRKWLWKKADSLITYTRSEKLLLISNGVPEQKIFVAFNTVDTDTFLSARATLESEGREAVKKRIGFTHAFNLTFIGRLYADKRPELLLDVLIGLQQRGISSVAVHFVGDGEMLAILKNKIEQLGLEQQAFCHGAIYDEFRSGEILFASDLMIMPGCVGLSVNHAFCFNCPVVTFAEVGGEPAHGPEIEYVIDGKTGFLIHDHSTITLTSIVAGYLGSADQRSAMISEVRKFIEEECSVSAMAQGIIDAINYNSATK